VSAEAGEDKRIRLPRPCRAVAASLGESADGMARAQLFLESIAIELEPQAGLKENPERSLSWT
jgi:hypothetical protein